MALEAPDTRTGSVAGRVSGVNAGLCGAKITAPFYPLLRVPEKASLAIQRPAAAAPTGRIGPENAARSGRTRKIFPI